MPTTRRNSMVPSCPTSIAQTSLRLAMPPPSNAKPTATPNRLPNVHALRDDGERTADQRQRTDAKKHKAGGYRPAPGLDTEDAIIHGAIPCGNESESQALRAPGAWRLPGVP
ncbi:MAG: hypothetical protein M3440_01070 [Chloroflexota bacterium]|nr:hypothetical protein [Chloroflexota bacterium]